MRLDELDYEVAAGSVAQRPVADRDSARLLVLPSDGEPYDRIVRDLPSLLEPGALVVLNDTRVVPSRLLGHKSGTGGKAELLLLTRVDSGDSSATQRWEALGRASKGLPEGCELEFGALRGRVISASESGAGVIEVELTSRAEPVAAALASIGRVPLPPYIRRADDADDRDRYQTVFARKDGAVAAPTAGLHFTEALLARLRDAGHRVATLTLHVGLGTFQPVACENLDDHPMHEETFDIPDHTADAVLEARRRGAPVVAVGTTVVRALESAAVAAGDRVVRSGRGTTRLLIQPGYRFRVVGQLLTNFHVPRSTLLALVCAFGGRSRILSAYRHAQASGYRFFSYGDAMLVTPKDASSTP